MKTNKKINPLILGTAVLTSAGVISRLIGFLYRIFLSRAIGATALGLYQLVFPILGLCYAISFTGIQTAISKYVAQAIAYDGKKNEGKNAHSYLLCGLILSTVISALCTLLLYFSSDKLAINVLKDARCGALLRILSFTILPASIHSCINGYYYGKKKSLVPAIGQLAEQFARVGSVYLMYVISLEKGFPLTSTHAVWGIFFSEIAGLMVSLCALQFSGGNCNKTSITSYLAVFSSLSAMALPLTFNQTLLHFCSSLENILIPQSLQAYGLSAENALSVYGVLSGMVISVIFFPCVLTNSIAVLLLPSVSEAAAKKDSKKINHITALAIRYGLLFGFSFTAAFLLFGNFIGTVLFKNVLAGVLIRKLSWLSPMMYVYSLVCSILHGLGLAKKVLYINLLSSLIRISLICFLVPRYGLSALLWGMLISQLFSALAAVYQVHMQKVV